MELWYEPRIVDFDRNDTLKIKGLSYENGFESFVSLSPNEQYVVIDNIIKGYVETPTGRELHENYKCVLIDLFSARVLDFWQSECSGEWDENSNWVNGDKIVFLSEMTK
jgi:hypothetical protein